MIDTFVLVAPLYLLAVIALLGFVGCGFSVHVSQAGPLLRCTADDHTVELSWDFVTDASVYHVKRREEGGTYPALGERVFAPSTIYHDSDVTNGTLYYYVVSALLSKGTELAEETSNSNEVKALPLGSFVTTVTSGSPSLSGRSGLYGMAIRVGSSDLTIHTLGRGFGLGLTGAHDVKVIDAISKAEVCNALVSMNSNAIGGFRYAKVVPSDPATAQVILTAGRLYYVVSQEFADRFYEQDTTVMTKPDATVESAIYSDVPGSFVAVGGVGHTYGPVSFQY